MSRSKTCLIKIMVLALTAAATAPVLGNAGPPSSGGHYAGEPAGITGVSIVREQLAIDMRPLASGGLVQVEAIYQLRNQGEVKNQDLLFAVGSAGVTRFRVHFDDKPIDSRPSKAELPASWKPPEHTPGLGEDARPLDYLTYGRSQVVPMAFALTIPPGNHTLKVRYAAEAARHQFGHPTVFRQFAYVLSPARSWDGFGGLDVSIQTPQGWRAACSQVLSRSEDSFTGSFDALPSDAIALTVQAPEGWVYEPVRYGSMALLACVVFLGGAIPWAVGRRQGAIGSTAWPAACALGCLWCLGIWCTGILTLAGPDWVLPEGQASSWNYGHFFAAMAIFGLGILVAPLGFALTLVAASRVAR